MKEKQMIKRKIKRIGCLALALCMTAFSVSACSGSKKKTKKDGNGEADNTVKVTDLGILGENTAYPIKMSLDSTGLLLLSMERGGDVNWVLDGVGELTVEQGVERSEDSIRIQTPEEEEADEIDDGTGMEGDNPEEAGDTDGEETGDSDGGEAEAVSSQQNPSAGEDPNRGTTDAGQAVNGAAGENPTEQESLDEFPDYLRCICRKRIFGSFGKSTGG